MGGKINVVMEDIIFGVFGVITGGDELKILWCHMNSLLDPKTTCNLLVNFSN